MPLATTAKQNSGGVLIQAAPDLPGSNMHIEPNYNCVHMSEQGRSDARHAGQSTYVSPVLPIRTYIQQVSCTIEDVKEPAQNSIPGLLR